MDAVSGDYASIGRSEVVSKILQAACDLTGMRFAAVAHVTSERWLACAVLDNVDFGLRSGDELEVLSTLCKEVRECGRTIVIDHVAEDTVYFDHQTPRIYGFQSYISTPIKRYGEFFGTLCALDPNPAQPSSKAIVATFELFADLIGRQLEADARLDRAAALVEFSDRSRDVQDPIELSYLAAEILGRTLDVARCGYATVDPDREIATVEKDWAAHGVESLAGVHRFRDYGSFIEDLKLGKTVVFTDADDDLRTGDRRGALASIKARAIVNIPIIENERLVALLYLHSAAPRQWAQAELDFVQQVADRTRTVIERRRAEQNLHELAETLENQVVERTAELRQYHDIVEATVAPICAFDRSLRLIAFNEAHNREFRRVNGFDTQIGDVFPELFIPEQQPKMRALMERALTGESFTVVEEFGRPELGVPIWEIVYTPLRGENGEIIGAFHHATDISDRLVAEAHLKNAQDALRQSQKMEAMGSLTGGVAHDFNNLLTPIIGSLDLLFRKQVGNAREQQLIDGALQSAERAKVLVQRLLAFARRQPLQPISIDLKQLVPGIVDLIASTIGPAIRVKFELADDLPMAKADPNQLEMALLNLAVNARDAMGEGGEITISASAETLPPDHPSGVAAGQYIRLSVSDTGAGMDEATRLRAVEPFFSTKGLGKGTGLGLSMVHGLVAQLGGNLSIRSELGAGTSVQLLLPTSIEPILQEQQPATSPPAGKARGTALLVDDEVLVRESTANMLAELGFRVVEAGSAEEALQHLKGKKPLDLLVTDHLMPGMSGAELAREVRQQRPELPILVVSGYAEVEGIAPDLPRLSKPFRNAELAGKVAAVMASVSGHQS